MYTALLQYAKEHKMTVKDFNCITSPMEEQPNQRRSTCNWKFLMQ